MASGRWQRNQRKAAEALVGATVSSWHGVEMAIRDVGASGLPEFEVDGVDCLQLWRIEIETDRGDVTMSTYQADDLWGLQIDHVEKVARFETDGIFRHRALSELPVGEIDAVTTRVTIPNYNLAEVVVEVDGREVVLLAGEIEERSNNILAYRWCDESVLVFTEPESVATKNWTPPRRPGISFVERRCPPRPIDSIPDLLSAAVSSIPIGQDVEDDELLRSLGIHIERLWRTHQDEIAGWPTGHTTDGTSIHSCYRAAKNVVEAFGTSCYDFGPDAFVFRARFRSEPDDQTTVELAVETPPHSGGPRLRSDSPIVLTDKRSATSYRTASLTSNGSPGPIEWVDAITLTETKQHGPLASGDCRQMDYEIPWHAQLEKTAPHGSTVGQLLPSGFDAYLRVFHPLVRWEANASDRRAEPRIATWGQLASVTGLKVGPTLTIRQLEAAFDTLEPTTGRIAAWEGELEESTAAALFQALDTEDAGSYRFAFGLATIIATNDHRPMLFETNSLKERNNVIDAVRNAGAVNTTTAENVWPVEQTWLTHTDYDLTSTYVACNAAAAHRILASDDLEAVLVDRSSRIDDHADEAVR